MKTMELNKKNLYNVECNRPIGGNCAGNCRKTEVNVECNRPIGGNCAGNCRKTDTESR